MNNLSKRYDVIVVGGGQAGLACGWHLKKRGLDFTILDEQDKPGGNWRHYYDSLTLFSPASYSSLPGMPFPGAPSAYPRRDEVVKYLEQYSKHFELPVQPNIRIVRVYRDSGGFRLLSENGMEFSTRAIVVATGAFSRPFIPNIAGLHSLEGMKIHSSSYRNVKPFVGKKVVVVGAANSALQIAYELAQVAKVTLATREKVRFFPQRILGVDFHSWLKWTGLERTRWLNDQSTPVLDDGTYRNALKSGLFAHNSMFERVTSSGVVWPSGAEDQIDSIIFATGFRPNIKPFEPLDILDPQQGVKQHQGVSTSNPGIFFVGLPKQRNFASATLRGVGPDSEQIMDSLHKYLNI